LVDIKARKRDASEGRRERFFTGQMKVSKPDQELSLLGLVLRVELLLALANRLLPC
jgi:hypothetical protein